MPKKRKSSASASADSTGQILDDIEQNVEDACELIEEIQYLNQDLNQRIMPRVIDIIQKLNLISIGLEERLFGKKHKMPEDMMVFIREPSIGDMQILMQLFSAVETIYSALRALPIVNFETAGNQNPYQTSAEEFDDRMILSMLDPNDVPKYAKPFIAKLKLAKYPLLIDLKEAIGMMKDIAVRDWPKKIDDAMQASARMKRAREDEESSTSATSSPASRGIRPRAR